MKIAYREWNPKSSTLRIVQQAEDIINEYESDGYTLTLRQLYYQFVARDIIENSEKSYKNLGKVIARGREAGLLSWTAIEDRNRSLKSFWFDENIMNPIRDLPGMIRYDRWDRQPFYIEVWVEKEALGNVIAKACRPYFVPHMSCKGYLSASEAWRAGMRFKEKMENGQECRLIHLGDHDPSGIDMTRDNQDRLDLFTEMPSGVHVTRLALNMDQIEEYNPPPNPTKFKDPRAKDYILDHGHTSWELDAIRPQILEQMIKNEIESYIDEYLWEKVNSEEEDARNTLRSVYDRWDDIKHLL